MVKKDAPKVSAAGGIPAEFPRLPMPAVFMFQPTKFEVVTGDRLKEWETLMKERVGLRADFKHYGIPTISCCPCADDCDEC